MTLKKILSLLVAVTMLFSCVGITAMAEEAADVAKIGDKTYTSFDDAISDASAMTGKVTVEIYGKVEYTDSTPELAAGNYDSISFVGMTDNAEISIKRNGSNGYIGRGSDAKVSFTKLILSKPEGFKAYDAECMNQAFTVYDAGSVEYTECIFPNGACASGCETTYIGCTFQKSHEKYPLWTYGDNTVVVVDDCTFDDDRGIKLWSYATGDKRTELTVKNCNFSNLTGKPAIVLTNGKSVTLEKNTYSSTGVFELDLDGAPNGTTVTSDVAPTCKNDNGVCGVLVDGKIYTTVAQAADVATEGSTVTLLHDSTETVEFAEGVTLDTNGYTAGGVTVATPVDTIDTMAELVEAVQTANSTITVGAVLTVAAGATYDLDLNGCTVKLGEYYIENNGTLTVTNGTIIADTYNSKTNGAPLWNKGNLTVYENTVISGVCSAVRNDGGTCVIEAGTLNATCKLGYSASIIRMKSGSLTIKDGIFNGCDDVNLGEGCSILSADDGTTVIIGGTFNNFAGSPGAIFGKGIGVTVKGGTFNFENKQDGFTYQDCLANYLAPGYGVDENGVVSPYVAQIGDTEYATLEAALKELTSGATITLLDNVTITEPWDERYTGARIKVPATIDGNGKTITFACDVADGNNYHSAFRVEAEGTVEFKNLTIDMSSATNSASTNKIRAISSKAGDLIVDNCTFIGNSSLTSTRAIIFGEGAQHSPETDITVKNSNFVSWKQGVIDNENGKDVGTVTITGNTFTNAGVNVSASKSVTFTGNTVSGAYVTITAYSNPTDLTVIAKDNTLEANTGTTASTSNRILVGTTIDAQDGFILPVIEPQGSINGGLVNVKDANRTFLTIESYLTYANESVVVKVYDANDTLLATSSLIDTKREILGKKDWGGLSTFVGINCTDEWWDTVWEKGKLNSNFVPAKATLIIDDVEMNTAPIQMRAAGTETEVVWADVPGVPAAELPNAEVTNLGAVSVTANDGDGDYKFGKNYYYVYDLLGNQQQKLKEETTPFEMNIAMQFVAKDTPEQAEANAYANYTTDFFIKIDGIKDDSFVGNGCYLAGYYPSFEAWVKIPLDGFTVENGKVYPVISSANFDFKYVDICTSVKDFICGIYLTPEIIAENPDIKVNLTLGLSENLEAAQNAEFTKVDDYTYDAEDFETVELFKIAGVNAKLGNSLAMNFFVAEADLNGEDYYAVIEHDDKEEGTVTEEIPYSAWEARTMSGIKYRVIAYSGLAARQMADDLTITIYNNDKIAVSVPYTESLSSYALKSLAYEATSESSKTAFVDMLNYGAAAQDYFNYNTENPASKGAEDYQSYASTEVNVESVLEFDEAGNGAGTSLTLKDRVLLNGFFKNVTDDMWAKITFTNHYNEEKVIEVKYDEFTKRDDYHIVTVDELVIADAGQPVKITVYNADGSVHGWITESVNGYLCRMMENEENKNEQIFPSLAKFAASARKTLNE